MKLSFFCWQNIILFFGQVPPLILQTNRKSSLQVQSFPLYLRICLTVLQQPFLDFWSLCIHRSSKYLSYLFVHVFTSSAFLDWTNSAYSLLLSHHNRAIPSKISCTTHTVNLDLLLSMPARVSSKSLLILLSSCSLQACQSNPYPIPVFRPFHFLFSFHNLDQYVCR